ncbi:mandelate racemase/muconate lactonizing enzyme family protein [Pseudofrankia saprophytica]|uniref:mandelate racemase/muconate lactonizing enzyme family protein n=1 Tax=Pseudofrankia saprophytica TaxID=298655 RepID=UPI000234BD29|nr:mandelate racemase/muconate lactonizing enzyme family protein [Pseudofrankia saprophytica]
MKITRIVPLPLTYPAALTQMSFFVVRVETDEGLVGYGEACDCFGVSYPRVLAAVVEDAFAPRLLGREVDGIDALIDGLRTGVRRELGETWSAAQARSAVEMALWDLVGQRTGRSLSAMFGRVRDRIPVYAGSSPFLDAHDVDYHLERLAPLVERGVRSVKMRIGPDPRRAVAVMAQLRDRLGDDYELLVDTSGWLDGPTSAYVADALAAVGVRWLEEPLPQRRHGAIQRVARRSPVPIAYGEHLYSLDDALDVLTSGEASVIQPDPAICGFADAYRIARVGPHYGARVALHYHNGPIGFAACLQLAGAAPTADILEFPFHLAPVLAAFSPDFEAGLDLIVDGQVAIPDRPGLGIRYDVDLALASLVGGQRARENDLSSHARRPSPLGLSGGAA